MRIFNIIKVILVVAIIIIIMTNIVYADVSDGLTKAKTKVISEVEEIVNNVVIPILNVVLIGLLAFAIAKAVIDYRRNRELEIGWVIMIIIGIVLINSFSTWGWDLMAK